MSDYIFDMVNLNEDDATYINSIEYLIRESFI